MTNYGNTGHRGYKMSKVTAIEPQGDIVMVSLACGHAQRWTPDLNRTAEEWARQIQEGYRPAVVGKTRLRCERAHEEAPAFAQGTCPNCKLDWSAHSAYIAGQERMCEEALSDGFSLHIHYTDQNDLWYAQAYQDDVFVTKHYGSRAIALCKQAITRRIKADQGELPMPAPIHTPKGFVDDMEDW